MTAGLGRRLLELAALAAVLALALMPTTAQASKKSTHLREGTTAEIDSLNPFVGTLESDYEIYGYEYDLLIAFDQKTLAPDTKHSLAESWSHSPDGKTWTYHLRHGLRWSDGVPLTSADVVFSMNLWHETAVNSDYLYGVKSWSAPDPFTVIAHLSTPSVRMDGIWLYILPEHVWKAMKIKGYDKYTPPLPIVGSGPYQVTHYDKSGTTILKRNPYFWQRNTGPQEIDYTFYGTTDEMIQDLRLNQADVITFEPQQYRTLSRTPDVKTYRSNTPGFEYWVFNQSKHAAPGVHTKVVQDIAIRRALAYGVDRQRLIHTALRDLGQRTTWVLNPVYKQWFVDFSKDPDVGYGYDPVKARAILDRAGWKIGSDGIRVRAGTRAEFDLWVGAGENYEVATAKLIQVMARDLGIKIDLRISTYSHMVDLEFNKCSGSSGCQPDYDTQMWSIGGDPTPYFLLSLWITGQIGTWNDSYYSNPTYDHLYKQVLSTIDVAKRKALMTRMQRQILSDLPYILLYNPDSLQAVNTRTWKHYTTLAGLPTYSYGYPTITHLEPGSAAAFTYPGVPWVVGVVIVLIVGATVWLIVVRRREESGPMEIDTGELQPLRAATPGGSA